MTATDNMESLADVIETDLVALGRKLADLKSAPGEETRKMLRGLPHYGSQLRGACGTGDP